MLGRADPQVSLLDTGSLLEGLIDPDSFYGRLAARGSAIVRDEDFADCYARGRGRPSIPPSTLMLACLLALHDGTSDRETAQQVRLNIGWKTALGLPIDHPGFHPTTFSVFRSRILLHDKDEQLFRTVVGRAIEAGVLPRRSLQLIDSSPIMGAAAVHDTYELLRQGIRRLVRAAGEVSLSKALRRHLRRYLRDAKPPIDWQNPRARRDELARMVDAADRLLGATVDRHDCHGAAQLLHQLLDQDLDRDGDDGAGPQIRRTVARDRILSVADPEMRHGRKSRRQRFNGYKIHLTEEPRSEIITAVAVSPGNVSDGDLAATLVEQARGNGVPPRELVGDMAYGDADTRVEVAQVGTTIVAKVPPITAGEGRFTKQDFHIELDPPAATCPAGVRTTTVVRRGIDAHGRPKVALSFPTSACAPCALRERCTTGRYRLVGLHHHEAVLQAARANQADPRIRRKLRRRPIIERKVDHLKDLGMGKARWRGQRKVLLQARLTAALANVKRIFVLELAPSPT